MRGASSLSDVPYLAGGAGLLGHSREINADRYGFVRRLAAESPDFVRLRSPVAHILIVNTPALHHELLVEKAKCFTKSYVLQFALRPIGGDGLFLSDGELWRHQRKVMAPLFQPAQLGRYVDQMQAIAQRTAAKWTDGGTVQFATEMTRVTMSIAGKTLFDADTFSEADELGHALTVALDWASENAPSFFSVGHAVGRRLAEKLADRATGRAHSMLTRVATRLRTPLFSLGARGRELRDAIALLDDRVARMISERRDREDAPDDLLSRLLAARSDDGAPMGSRQVRDEILTLFVAGHETTATALAWVMYELARHPAIRAQVEAEIDALGHAPTAADLPHLPLTLRVFKEALRLYPPVYMYSRQLVTPCTLGGVALEQPTLVFAVPYALHRRPEIYPDPERFDPDRFLPEQEKARHRLAWSPFGAGPRVCIGAQFALLEGHIVLATMMYHARFHVLGTVVPEPSATFRPHGSMPMRVELRRAQA